MEPDEIALNKVEGLAKGEGPGSQGHKLSKKDKRLAKIAKQKNLGEEEGKQTEDAEDKAIDEDMGEELEGATTAEATPLTCLVAFKEMVVGLLEENDLD